MRRNAVPALSLLLGLVACGGAGGTGAGGANAGGASATTASTSAASTGAVTSSASSTGAGTGGAAPCGKSGESCCAGFACDAGLSCDGTVCGDAVAPYACANGAPEVVFVGEVPPPSTLGPWDRPFASVTFANCGSTTWTAVAADAPMGVKLGSATPHDFELWTPTRLSLPADVPPGEKVTIVVPVHAPALTGPHPYAFELVREGVAWLGQASPIHTLDVEAASASPIEICPGVMADPSGTTSAEGALAACIAATPMGGTLALPPGIYRVSGVVTIDKPMTLSTAGASGAPSCLDYDAPKCAVLRADGAVTPSAQGTRGFLRLGALGTQVSSVTLDHVLVDGARDTRLGSASATHCAQGNNGDGINIGANCASCSVVGSGSARALCGSGLEWDGDGATITKSVFLGNGDHGTQNMWSDGLTIHKSDGATVDQCRFVDDSDVGFISGGGKNAHYTNNYAGQFNQASFAAMMLDNFNSPTLGDFSGATLTGNTVICATPCHFGIELGPHPWYASPNIQGGSVTANTVVGGHIEINAQGAGTQTNPTIVAGNHLGPTPASAPFQCGTVSGLSPLNVSPESHVDLQGGAATGSISVPCP